jgi:putative membrane protein
MTKNNRKNSHKTMNWLRRGMFVGTLALLGGGTALAADPPVTADVLTKLHESDQKEIEAGKLAQKNGQSPQVRDYGRMLVKDHTAADKKVASLAKEENVPLTDSAPASRARPDPMSGMTKDSTFDETFVRDMIDDHKKDIAAVTEARDNTTDDKLKKLLTDLLPTLQKHEEAAQKIADTAAARR